MSNVAAYYSTSNSSAAARQAVTEQTIALAHSLSSKPTLLPPQPGPKFFKKSHWRKLCLDKALAEATDKLDAVLEKPAREPPTQPPADPKLAAHYLTLNTLLQTLDTRLDTEPSTLDTSPSLSPLSPSETIDLIYLHITLTPPSCLTPFLPTSPPINLFTLTPTAITPYTTPGYMPADRASRKALQVLSLVKHAHAVKPGANSTDTPDCHVIEFGSGPGYVGLFYLYVRERSEWKQAET